LYKCNQMLKVVLPLHLSDLGPLLLWSSYSVFDIQEYYLWQMLLMLYVSVVKCLKLFSKLSSYRTEFLILIKLFWGVWVKMCLSKYIPVLTFGFVLHLFHRVRKF
jgi:hypothetical protein